jgi:aconitate hydratase
MSTDNSFNSKQTLKSGSKTYSYFSLKALEEKLGVSLQRLPVSLRILLENLLRRTN